MDHEKDTYDAFVATMARCRWFLLVATLLSGLVLAHVYLERFGYQEAQLIDALERRYVDDPKGVASFDSQFPRDMPISMAADQPIRKALDELDTLFAQRAGTPGLRESDSLTALYGNKRADLAARLYKRILTNNTLREATLQDRTIPVVGLTVPGNDYVPVMSFLVVVFLTALWLNTRALRLFINADTLARFPEFVDMLPLHFTFTGVAPSRGVGLARWVQNAAFLLPGMAIFAGSFGDLFPLATSRSQWEVLGDNAYVAVRVAWLLFATAFAAFLGVRCRAYANEYDAVLRATREGGAERGTEP